MSERRLTSVGELTSERLAELRRIAEAATPGPWEIPVANVFRLNRLAWSGKAFLRGAGGAE